ncbi:ABC transporter ATP-binding protein [Falsibacillus pallidus]|uniref:Carnitine transport ATP-binding protein OpuCA n=1 Tax=Falsibacillus pallidus TaxID=493781 RepID=A0A370G2V1_9BACI|nr:ABC transporter ATP-binding protein [Falsibacillus pallidus]RDI36924.1 putative spermidine/putrescine transport system ATP-binding protein [Falsibacillus pallidus]
MSFITINNIQKAFDGQKVLKNMNLTIHKGEFITLLGPSGCGKSTLLRIAAGLVSADEGSIFIDGVDVTHVSPKERGVGMVFQSYALFPNMNVYENVAFGLKMKKIEKQQLNERVMNMIRLVGLDGKENAYPHELSGGQQQRVALARSIVVEPKVLLLDEPLSALDAQIRKNLQKLLRDIQQRLGITMILVTHDQEEAMLVSDRIFILNKGEIVQNGNPQDLYKHPATEFVARFIGSYNVLEKDEMVQLFGSAPGSGMMYAIRPEAFLLNERENAIMLEAEIKDVAVLGNIVRYELEANGIQFSADLLQQSGIDWRANQKVELFLPQEDVIQLA